MILTRNNQAAVVGDICSSYEADEIETILRCEGIGQLELVLCDSKDTDESQGIDLLLQKFPVKVAAIPSEGSFSAHIEKALGKQPLIRRICRRLCWEMSKFTAEKLVWRLLPERKSC